MSKTGDVVAFLGTASVVKDLDYLGSLLYGDAPINYYGVSYGYMSVMLQPSRLGRIIIDGIANPNTWHGYPTQQLLNPETVDVDQVIEAFAASCAKGGPSLCPLAPLGSAADIVTALHSLIDQLYYSPLPVPNSLNAPGLTVSADLARWLLFQTSYDPSVWPASAAAFAEAIAGNGTLIALFGAPSVTGSLLNAASQPATFPYAAAAIICGDTTPFDSKNPAPSVEEFAKLLKGALANSPAMGESLYWLYFCDVWPTPSQSRFGGSLKLKANTLETPVLIFTNTYDPITPKEGAINAHKNLGTTNSKLVEQNGTAHTTQVMPSACILQILASCVLKGTVPTSDSTFCPLEDLPFGSYASTD